MSDGPHTLFAAKCDGTLTPEQQAELEKLLAGSAEARREWFLHCDLETGMADFAAARGERAPDVTSITPRPAKITHLRWFIPLAAAAGIAAIAFLWPRPKGAGPSAEAPATTVAVLARTVRAEWAGPAELHSGSALVPGSLQLKSGAVLIEFSGGARVVIEGPAEFRLVSAGEAFLSSGKLSGHVPPQARGFTVRTPQGAVVDHGTDFAVALREGAAPEVHVFTGQVEFDSTAQPPRPLAGGEAIRLDPAGAVPIPAERAEFLSEEELTRRESMDAADRLRVWREGTRTLSADPATRVHFTFDDPAAHTLANSAVAGLPGAIVGAEWTTGRWPGKGALQFRGESDRIRFSAPQPVLAVTLLAWVRVDSLPRWQNVLLACDSEEPGALHWHLTQHGELRLEIARDLGRAHTDWEAVNSAPFVTSSRLGQWLMLATTFDGQIIRHYGNGELIGSGPSFTPPALHIETAEIANWRGGTQRQLAATLDEFAILGRVMSAEELQAAFAAGKR